MVSKKSLVLGVALSIAPFIIPTLVAAQAVTEPNAFLQRTFTFPDQPPVEVPAELSAVPVWTVVSNGRNPAAAPSTWCNAWIEVKAVPGWDVDDCIASITQVSAAVYDYNLPADRRQWLRFWATRPQNFVYVVPSFAADQAEMLARVEAAAGVNGAIVNDPVALAALFRSELDELKADVTELQGDVGIIVGFLDTNNEEGITKAIQDVMAEELGAIRAERAETEARISEVAGRVDDLEVWTTQDAPALVAELVESNLMEALTDKSSPFRVFLDMEYGNQVGMALADDMSPLSIAFARNADQVAEALADETSALSVALKGNAGQVALALLQPDSLLNQELNKKAEQAAVTSLWGWLIYLAIATLVFAVPAIGVMVWQHYRTKQVERAVETTVEIPADLQDRLEQVASGGSAYEPVVKVNGVVCRARVTAGPTAKDGESMFFIDGIEGHRSMNPVKKSNVPSLLIKAGNNGRFKGAHAGTTATRTSAVRAPSGALPV